MKEIKHKKTWAGIIAILCSLAGFFLGEDIHAAEPERIVIYDGTTIVLPEDADLCVYDKRCMWGFTVAGRFPGLEYRDAILKALQGTGLVLEYPLCEEGLTISLGTHPLPCYALILE